MNKWRLLLFSVFGLLQITTSDRFIDGCNHRVSRSDTRVSTYEPYRHSPELRQLKSPDFRRTHQERRSITGFNRRESPQDESRRAIENRGIRELTDVTERDISRARSYEDRTISSGSDRRDVLVNRDRQWALNTRSTVTRDDDRRNDLRRYSTNTRETFARDAREGRFNVRRDNLEREVRKDSRLATHDKNTDYDKENRNTMLKTKRVTIVKSNSDDSGARAQHTARRETFETRIVNNLEDRVGRLRTRRNSLKELREGDELSSRIRSARNYDSAESKNSAGFIRDNRNRDGRDNVRDRSLRTLRERLMTENSLSERANERNIRLGKRNASEGTARNIRTNMYTDDNNIVANARSREYREITTQRVSDNLERNSNDNHDNRLSRRTIDKDALNTMERHIQVDSSRIAGLFSNSRDSRDNRISERRSNERLVRDWSDGMRRERDVRKDVRQERLCDMEESRIRSSSVPKTYFTENTRKYVSNEIRRVRSNSAEQRNIPEMDERHRTRRNLNLNALEYKSRELRQEQNIGHQIDVSRIYRKTAAADDQIRKSRYNVNEASHTIRSQSPQERRLNREARDSGTRKQTNRDEYLHRIRSRSLEERFSRVQDRDEYKTISIRSNEESRQQSGRNVENRSTYAPRIRNIRLSTMNDVRNSRYNDVEEFQQIRSLKMQERSHWYARDTPTRTNIRDIRDTREKPRKMQERQITPNDRSETRIRTANPHMSSDRNIRDNGESRRRIKRNTMERQSIEREYRVQNNLRKNEESRVMQSPGIERTLARKETDMAIHNINARNTRNIREEINRVRSRSLQHRRDVRETEKDDVGIRTLGATRTSDVRNTRDYDKRERLMDGNIPKNRQNYENRREIVERRRTTLVRENREKLNIDSIRSIPEINKKSENYVYEIKWQYLFYALQGIYLCSLFMKISKDEKSKKNFRTTSWLSPVDYLKID